MQSTSSHHCNCPRPVGLIETATIIVCDQQPPVSCARGLLRPQLDAGGHLYKKWCYVKIFLTFTSACL